MEASCPPSVPSGHLPLEGGRSNAGGAAPAQGLAREALIPPSRGRWQPKADGGGDAISPAAT